MGPHSVRANIEVGRQYARQIIPLAAKAEVDAMAELCDEGIVELVRITTLFSNHMKQRFDALNAQKYTKNTKTERK